MVSKYSTTADTPRAHITNQRTVEIMRDLGIEDQILAEAAPHEQIGETVICTTIAGEELGRVRSWGNRPDRHADYVAASPSLNCDLPQTHLEPILVRNAQARGAKYRWKTEFVTLQQDDGAVHALVHDQLTGTSYTVHAKYLVGADGGRSRVVEQLGLPMEGLMGKSGSMNIVCDMDLSPYCENRESVLYWVLQPGAAIGGIGLGLVRMVRPLNKWLITWGYDIEQPPPELTKESTREIVRNLIGDPNLDIEVESFSLWTVNEMRATRNMEGRVFAMGDATHRHPPSNGLGSNTSIGDAYNLAWKLAYVLKGFAGPELLGSYQDERVPVGEQIVKRANTSLGQFGAVLDALGVDPRDDAESMNRQIATRKEASEEGERRRQAVRDALELKNYEFNADGSDRVGISTLLTVNGSQYLIDCGEGWGPSYRRSGESPPGLEHGIDTIKAVFITHQSDHTVDYPNLLLLAWHNGSKAHRRGPRLLPGTVEHDQKTDDRPPQGPPRRAVHRIGTHGDGDPAPRETGTVRPPDPRTAARHRPAVVHRLRIRGTRDRRAAAHPRHTQGRRGGRGRPVRGRVARQLQDGVGLAPRVRREAGDLPRPPPAADPHDHERGQDRQERIGPGAAPHPRVAGWFRVRRAVDIRAETAPAPRQRFRTPAPPGYRD